MKLLVFYVWKVAAIMSGLVTGLSSLVVKSPGKLEACLHIGLKQQLY